MQWTVTVLGRKLPASLTFPALVFSAFYTASLLYLSAVLRSPVKIAPILFPSHSALSNWPHNTKKSDHVVLFQRHVYFILKRRSGSLACRRLSAFDSMRFQMRRTVAAAHRSNRARTQRLAEPTRCSSSGSTPLHHGFALLSAG